MIGGGMRVVVLVCVCAHLRQWIDAEHRLRRIVGIRQCTMLALVSNLALILVSN